MARLNKQAILQVVDLATEEVEVPEWGGSVLVRGMTGTERDLFETEIVLLRDGKKAELVRENIRAKLVARCIVDDEGERVFEDADIQALGKKSASALDRIFSVAQRLSGITKEDAEELAKN